MPLIKEVKMNDMQELCRTFVHHFKTHHHVKPLAATCALAACFSTYICVRSSQKLEVIWDRWGQDRTDMRKLERTAVNRNVRFHPISINKEQYFVDEDKVALLDLIYEDKDYKH